MSLGPSLSLPHSHLSLFPIFSGLWTHCNCRWFSSCIQERWRKTLPLISSLQFVIPRLGELLLLLLSHSVVSNSVRLQRRQPTRLLCPRDSPGKNTGVGCRFLLQCMHVCQVALVVSDFVRPYGQQPTRLLCPRDSLGKNTGMGCHFLLQQLP